MAGLVLVACPLLHGFVSQTRHSPPLSTSATSAVVLDEHDSYCGCGDSCRKESCCCRPGPSEPAGGGAEAVPTASPAPKVMPAAARRKVSPFCVGVPPAESGIPANPVVKAVPPLDAATSVLAMLRFEGPGTALIVAADPRPPMRRASRLDRPPNA